MSTIQHLLEKQRKEAAEKICRLTDGMLHPNDILPDLSTIQQAAREDVIGKIGAKLLARHSPQNVLDAYFEAANEELKDNDKENETNN